MSESSPRLLDLMIPKNNKGWKVVNGDKDEIKSSSDETNKLELRLGLPGGDDNGGDMFSAKSNPKNISSWERKESSSLLSMNYFHAAGFQTQQQQYPTGPNNAKGFPVMANESSSPSQACCTRIVDLQSAEKKAFSSTTPSPANTAVPNTSQKRAAPAPVVGWPPIRSFRKNLASTSSAKPVSELPNPIPSKPVNEKPAANENSRKGLFVKINMDGVPIGRKVDLSAYDNYDKLSSAVDELFRGLLAAQSDASGGGTENKKEEQKPITGLLDGSGEYTLVYEDNEGDRMLVGDVPWHMFVSTVKRLRVLKSSDLPTLSRGGNKDGKLLVESATK